MMSSNTTILQKNHGSNFLKNTTISTTFKARDMPCYSVLCGKAPYFRGFRDKQTCYIKEHKKS